MRSKKFYVTTPLYPADDKPHLGHACAALAADVLARHLRAKDVPAHFQTGTCEHGAGVEAAALRRGAAPGDWCGAVAGEFRALWETLDVRCDRFLRTTEPAHEACVQAAFEKLLKSDDIYKGPAEGRWCPSCETFYAEADLRGGGCPVHGGPAERAGGETYFFRLSRYERPLLEHYARHPAFLAPGGPARELREAVRAGLKDLPAARAATAWGAPLKCDPAHAPCAWFHALLGYASGAGCHPDGPSPDPGALWPPDVQLTGRELFRLHGAVWPAVLLALGLELPRRVFAHGRWTLDGREMSRARGSFIKAEDVAREYGVDALRYFLLRETPFGQDGDFSMEAFRRRYNADLAGDLGHLFARTMKMAGSYLEHRLPRRPEKSEIFTELSALTPEIHRAVEELNFSGALELVWGAVGRLNRLVDERKPWDLARRDPAALKAFLHELVWCLRLAAGWLDPFMPGTASKMHLELGVGAAAAGVEPQQLPPLFPRKQDDKPGHPHLN